MKNNTFTTLALFILVGAVGFLLGRTTCSSNCSDGNYEVSQDWKGLVFKGSTQSFEISLDQFWERDKKRNTKELQRFYA